MAGRRDAGRAHDVQPEIALLADVRLAGVEPHAHAHRAPVRPLVVAEGALGVDRGRDCVARPREREEEGVALRVDLRAAARAEGLAHEPPVVGRDVSVRLVAELLQEARRALDVREDERDGAAGQLGHRAYATPMNRLAQETSPYLLQHADNPVDWHPWGEEAFAAGAERGQAAARLDRLLRLPLVPRDGARVVRRRGDRGRHERALRQRQGRPRGAARRRRGLHGRRRRAHRAGRLAAHRLPHARRRAVLRRHVLPAGAAARAARPSGRCCARSRTHTGSGRTTSPRRRRRSSARCAGRPRRSPRASR